MANEMTKNDNSERKKNAAKKIVRGGIMLCTGAFFGAIAGYVTNDAKANKIEKSLTVSGGMIVGTFIGGRASDIVCEQIDRLAERWMQINKEETTDG